MRQTWLNHRVTHAPAPLAVPCRGGYTKRMNGSDRSMDSSEWLLLLALSVLWGSSFFFYKILGHALPTLTIVLGRVGLAAVVLNAVLLMRRSPLTRAMPWGSFVLLGVLNSAVPFTLFAWGETRIASGMAAMLNTATPVFSIMLAHLLGREPWNWAKAAGAVLCLCGVAVLIGPTALAGAIGGLAGEAACLGAALSYAVGGQFARKLQHLPPIQVATGQLTAAALVLLPPAVIADRFWLLPAPASGTWAALAGIALLCTALAYILFFRIIATAGATNAMLVTFLLPVSALLLGRLFLGEPIPARAYAGMMLIGAGLAAIDGRLVRLAFVRQPAA